MRVLVTGGTGFVGAHTAAALARAGHDVRLLARDPAKAERVLAEHGIAGCEIARGDLADAPSVAAAVDGCAAVVHSAAVVSLDAHRGEEVYRTNVRGSESVFAAAQRCGVESLVYVSSAGALFTPGGPPVGPESPIATQSSWYMRSKADAERGARTLLDGGAPLRITYPVGVVGPDDPGLSESNHMVRTLLHDFVPLTSSGVNLVDVRDLALMHVAMVEGRVPPGRYVAAGRFLSWADLGALLERITGRTLRKVRVPGAALRAAGRIFDVLKRFRDVELPITHEAMIFATQWPGADGSATTTSTGIADRPLEESLADTLRWLVAAERLRPEHVGKLMS